MPRAAHGLARRILILGRRMTDAFGRGTPAVMTTIYKICTAAEWSEAERSGAYRGSAVDLKDGFIHFSTAEQAAETAAKWFAGQHDLVLVAVAADELGDKLKWEPSRGGALFPHLYGELPVKTALRVDPLPLDDNGRHAFPRFYC